MEEKAIISLQKAYKFWYAGQDRIRILEDVDMEVFQGESLAIMGPSGSGKSTLMHVLAFLCPLDQGSISYRGLVFKRADHGHQRQILREISFVFQDAKLIPNMTVHENIAVPLFHRGIGKKMRNEQICEVLEKVSMSNRMFHYPQQLSGGELMRVAVARAIITKPKVIFADEPIGNLDSQMGEKIADILFALVSPSTAVVVVSHQLEMAQRADRVLYLKDGRLSIAT